MHFEAKRKKSKASEGETTNTTKKRKEKKKEKRARLPQEKHQIQSRSMRVGLVGAFDRKRKTNRKTNLRIADDFRKQKGSLFTDLSKSWCIHLYRNQEQKTMAIYLSFLCTVYIVLRCSVKRRKKSTTYDMSIPQQV